MVPKTLILCCGLVSSANVEMIGGFGLNSCMEIIQSCKDAGFVNGGGVFGSGIHKNCYGPILLNMQQPNNSKIALPNIDNSIILECQKVIVKVHQPTFKTPGSTIDITAATSTSQTCI